MTGYAAVLVASLAVLGVLCVLACTSLVLAAVRITSQRLDDVVDRIAPRPDFSRALGDLEAARARREQRGGVA